MWWTCTSPRCTQSLPLLDITTCEHCVLEKKQGMWVGYCICSGLFYQFSKFARTQKTWVWSNLLNYKKKWFLFCFLKIFLLLAVLFFRAHHSEKLPDTIICGAEMCHFQGRLGKHIGRLRASRSQSGTNERWGRSGSFIFVINISMIWRSGNSRQQPCDHRLLFPNLCGSTPLLNCKSACKGFSVGGLACWTSD